MTHTTPSNRQIVTPPNMSCPSILEFARLELLNHLSVTNLRQQKTHFADNSLTVSKATHLQFDSLKAF